MLQWQQKLLSSSLQERSPQPESHSAQFFLPIAGVGWLTTETLSDFSDLLPNPERLLYWLAILGLGYGVYALSSRLSALPDEDDESFEEEHGTANRDLSENNLSEDENDEDNKNDDDEKDDRHDKSGSTFS